MPQRGWSIRTVVGQSLGSGSDNWKALSRLNYILLMFPPDELATIVTLTLEQLVHQQKDPTTTGEILKLFEYSY